MMVVERYAAINHLQPTDKKIMAQLVSMFEDVNGRAFARYKIEITGLKPGFKTHLMSYYGGYYNPIHMDLLTDSQGCVHQILSNGKMSSDPVFITIDARPGARTYLFLMTYTPNLSPLLASKITPHPWLITTDDGAQVELSRVEKAANLVLIELSGFKQKELVSIISRSEDETIHSKIPTDENGFGLFVLNPGVLTKNEGNASIALTRNDQTHEIKYQWSKKDWTTEDYADYKQHLESTTL